MLALVQNFYLSIYLCSLNRVRNLNVSYVKIHIYRLQFVDPDVLWQRCWRQSSSILATDRKNNFSDEVWRRLACIITTLYVECVACSAFLPPVNSNRVVIRAERIQHSASCRQMSAGYITYMTTVRVCCCQLLTSVFSSWNHARGWFTTKIPVRTESIANYKRSIRLIYKVPGNNISFIIRFFVV